MPRIAIACPGLVVYQYANVNYGISSLAVAPTFPKFWSYATVLCCTCHLLLQGCNTRQHLAFHVLQQSPTSCRNVADLIAVSKYVYSGSRVSTADQ
jgi:hypothetical protein